MNIAELLILAVGLSMDAFAVAVCKGLCMRRFRWKYALLVGVYFGIFQALMPLAGYFLASLFANRIQAYDHWIAFVLLGFIGGKMINDSFDKKDETTCDADGASFGVRVMLPLALATSIDAMAMGITFAFLRTNIAAAVSLIGAVTLILSAAGVKIGHKFGARFESKAELIGGVLLILMGLKILLEHTLLS